MASSVPGPGACPAPDDDIRLAFDYAPVGLCVTRERVIGPCNAAFAEMFGYAIEELIGHSIEILYPSHQEFENIGDRGLEPMKASGHYSDERIMRHRSNGLFWCHVSGRSIDRAHPFAHAVWMFEDLSSRRPVTAALTAREREVAQLLATGKTSKHIAKALKVSSRTVEAHRARLMRKFEANTAGALIARLVGRT